MKKAQKLDRKTVIEKFRYLHHLLACMKCGVWGSENFVSGNCDHFQCGQCLKDLGNHFKVKCGVRYPYESSHECSKFFGHGSVKPEAFINEKYAETIALMERYGISFEEIISPQSLPNINASLQKIKTNEVVPEKSNSEIDKNADEQEELLSSLGQPKIFEVSSQDHNISDEGENRDSNENVKEKSMSVFELNDSFSAPTGKEKHNNTRARSTNRSVMETRKSVPVAGFDFFQNFKTKQNARARCSKDRKERKRTSNDETATGSECEKEKENEIAVKAPRTSANSTSSKRALFDMSAASNQSMERTESPSPNPDSQQEIDEGVIRKLRKKNHNGETELHQESKRGNLDRVLQLLELGADPNTKDNANLRPLHEHKALQNREVCQTLLEFGADPRVHGGDNDVTPLHVAVQNGFTDVISLLVQCGADIHAAAKAAGGNKFSPLSLAKFYGNAEVIELLESSHAKYHGSENSNEDNGLKDYVTTPLRKSKFNVEVTRLNKTLTPVAKQQKDDAITQFSHSGLCSKSKAICHAFSKQFKIKINSEFDESCNVLVLVKKAETNEYSKTVKAAAAIMRGGLLVDLKWAEESLKKGQIFSYQEYLIDSFADYQDSVKQAREAHLLSKKLFSGLEVFVKNTIDAEGTIGCQQLKELLSLSGAKLLPREPKASSLLDNNDFMNSAKRRPEFLPENSRINDMRVVVVVGDSIEGASNAALKQVIPGLYQATSHWVLECIWSFSIIISEN